MTKINQDEIRRIAEEKVFCTRCHQPLDPASAVWLDMNWETHEYSDEAWPEDKSQGCFAFGNYILDSLSASGLHSPTCRTLAQKSWPRSGV